MENLWKLLLSWFGNPVRGLAALMIAALVVLGFYRLQPLSAAVVMMDPFLRWPVLILILSSAGLATYPLEHGWKWTAEKRQKKAHEKQIIARLSDLTPHEKKVLRRYLENDGTTANWGHAGGPVEVLAHDGILWLLTQNPNPNDRAPNVYAINKVAWSHLQLHPELIDLELNTRPVTPPPA